MSNVPFGSICHPAYDSTDQHRESLAVQQSSLSAEQLENRQCLPSFSSRKVSLPLNTFHTLPRNYNRSQQQHAFQPLFPATISPVPFQTSNGGYFFPSTPTVIVPPRQMMPQAPPVTPNVAASTAYENSSSEDLSSESHCCMSCYENQTVRRTLCTLVIGQLVSLCLCGSGVSSELLAHSKFNAPAAQNFFNYFLLFFIYGLIIVCRSGERNMLNVVRERGWKYLVLAFLDVQANYLIVYAYQFTNLTSIQILDCSVIPVVMVLSWLFLSIRYLIFHLVGVSVCLVGIGLIIYVDTINGRSTEGGHGRLFGDLLCLSAALLYGVANVTEEFLVKQYDRFEYLGMVGLFGSVITCAQIAVFEHSQLATFSWTVSMLIEYALYTACMFFFYSLVSMMMEQTSALMFNLAVLSSDFYSLLAGMLIFSYSFNILYLVSFVIVITGSIIYSVHKTKERSRAEAKLTSKIFCFCFPCATCIECRPRAAYTVRDAQRTPSVSPETPTSSLRSSA